MIDEFYKSLKDNDISNILEKSVYQYQGFHNDEKLFSMYDDIIANNRKVLIHGDPDPDGVFALKIQQGMFDRLNFSNYTLWKYNSRSHNMENDVVAHAIYNNYDYLIILDSSSNAMDDIRKLVKFGVKVIVIDHHQCDWDYSSYPEDCTIINCTMDNRLRRQEFYKLSAGALTFCLVSEYLKRKERPYKDLSAYALVTLYSDCIDMTRDLNRGIYYMATGLAESVLPICIRHFMERYSVFSRRFIEYTFVPKINALFRAERFDIINRYLLETPDYNECINLVKTIKDNHVETKKKLDTITDIIQKDNLNNLVIANLSSINISINLDKLYNYTGLVANNISQEFGKPCIVLCDNPKDNCIKGSFRDLLSRNYLPRFKQFCSAAGHGAAFGIKIPYSDYADFMRYVKNQIDKKFFILGVRDPIEINCGEEIPNDDLIKLMAQYNEFSGVDVPIALLTKKNNLKAVRGYNSSYQYQYKWGQYVIKSKSRIIPGGLMKVKPVKTKSINLLAYNRNVLL